MLTASINSINAQVKIGDNPNTINPNSMLELESTNKGFLPPRVVLNNINLVTPLSSSVTPGMLIYSSGGAVADGYYYWSGTKWLAINTSVNRSNYVLVKTAADFPAAVGGVITLVSGVLYELNGTVSLSSKIDLNGASICGVDPVNDKLVYTGTSELFTGSGVGNLRYLSLAAPAGSLFNINAGGSYVNFIVQNCYILGCSSVGTIQSVGGTVFFSNVAYFSNTNGITFQNDNNVVLSNTLWDISNSNIYEKFIGTFNLIQILGGDRLVNSGNTALSISGITTVTIASIKVVMFVGAGTYVSGVFSNSWEVEASGLNTEKDDVASGNIYISTPAVTTFTAANTATKVSGTTTSTNLFRVSSPMNNRLTYSGTKTKKFMVMCSLSFTALGNNKNYSFYIAKNGVILPESKISRKINTGTDQGAVPVSCTISLAPNDYIEIWAENNTDVIGLTVESMNVAIK